MSQAERKRRSAAASSLYGAASVLRLYGQSERTARRLEAIAEDIHNGKLERSTTTNKEN